MVGYVGEKTIDFLAYTNRVATLAGYGAYRLTVGLPRINRVSWAVLKRQILFTGVEALPFAARIGLLSSVMVMLLSVSLSQVVGLSMDQLGEMIVLVFVRVFGPFIAAYIIIGRSCTAISAELANMSVNREIESLENMGIDPFEYLVLPRMAGVTVAMFCVSVFLVAVSLGGGGVLVGAWTLVSGGSAQSVDEYLHALVSNLTLPDVTVFVAKTLMVGVAVSAVSCLEGLSVSKSVTEVPQATTRGVVNSIGVVFACFALIDGLAFLLQ